MKDDEMASLMVTSIGRSGGIFSSATIPEKELEELAKVVDGHALGACRAISYILHVLAQTADESPATIFLDIFNGSEWESRLQFLEYKPRIGLSVMETFASSLERIRRHQTEAVRLLELLAFLSGKNKSLNFRKFLGLQRPWLEEFQRLLPDCDIFARKLTSQMEYLAELENVSIGVRPDISSPLQIHPLWLECIQQRAGHEGRVRWIRQIILLCFGSHTRDEGEDSLVWQPFLKNAFAIATRFRIRPRELFESKAIMTWINTLGEETEHSVSEPCTDSERSDEAETVNIIKEDIPKAIGAPDTTGEMGHLSQEMVNLRDSCKDVADALTSSNTSKMSEGAFGTWVQRYLALLRRLKSLEDTGKDLRAVVTLHLEIYDLLLGMAPTFEHLNPRLGALLREKKEGIQR